MEETVSRFGPIPMLTYLNSRVYGRSPPVVKHEAGMAGRPLVAVVKCHMGSAPATIGSTLIG